MNEKTLIDFLSLSNPWWQGDRNFPLDRTHPIKRTDFYYLWQRRLLEEEALLICGPRGVGKSTVMYEIIRELLNIDRVTSNMMKQGGGEPHIIEPVMGKRILYISFEDPILKKFNLQDILTIYAKYVLQEDIAKLSGKIYAFFDEIQNIENWGDQIKAIYDRNFGIKFFITGSSSVALKNESAKAARRLSSYSMHPLKFLDFMRFKITDSKFSEIMKIIKKVRWEILEAVKNNNPQKVYDNFIELYLGLKPWQTQVELGFKEYIIKGGYPKYVNEGDLQKISSKLNETFKLGFHKDLVLGGNIGDPKGMENLTTYIASISSSETSYNSLIENTRAASNSDHMRKYLYHLQTSFLVEESNKYSPSIKKQVRGFKIYLVDIAIRNMLQGVLNKLFESDTTQQGLTLETLIFEHSLRLFHKMRGAYPMQYWKGSRDQEVDIVLQLNGVGLPIEVKHSDEPSYQNLSGLKAFTKKYNVPGLVVCGKKLELKENIIFLPHWLYCIIC